MILKKVLFLCLFASSLVYAGVGGVWGYSGHSDPAHWGDLKPEFAMCKKGKNQAPINISDTNILSAGALEEIGFHYTEGATQAENNGHTVKVSVAPGNYIIIDDIKFELKQFHFHSPSENQIHGKNFPLEAHFVHQSKDGELAVIAVMYEEGKENKVLKKICKKVFSHIHQVNQCGLTATDINMLLPKNKDYYRFSGSLTTPPCSEGVRWLVLQNYLEISKQQIEKFVTVMMKGHNNRPVQSLNARKILKK